MILILKILGAIWLTSTLIMVGANLAAHISARRKGYDFYMSPTKYIFITFLPIIHTFAAITFLIGHDE